MKKIVTLLMLIICFSAFILYDNENAHAESSNSSNIVYYAFGDSITEGTVLTQSGNDGNENLILKQDADGSNYYTKNRYPNLIEAKLLESIDSATYQNYADASDTLDDFVTVYQGVSSLEDATLVTLCIGANDILGQAISSIQTSIQDVLLDFALGSITETEVQETIIANVEASMASGADYFYNNFQSVLSQFLSELNDRANVFVTTIYNPYKDVVATINVDVDVAIGPFQIDKSITLAIDFSTITQKYLSVDGGYAHPINKTITEVVEGLASNSSVQNLSLVDIASTFDSAYLEQGLEAYKNLILVKDEIRNSEITPYQIIVNDLNNFNINAIVNDLSYLLDPHLSDEGHNVFFQTLWNSIQSSCTNSALTLSVNSQDANQTIYTNQTNEISGFTDSTYTLSSTESVYLDVFKQGQSVYTSSASSTSHQLPLAELGNGTYTFKVTPNNSSCYYSFPITVNLTEPEPEPFNLQVFLNQIELTDEQKLDDIWVNQSLTFTTNAQAYVKIMQGTLEVSSGLTTENAFTYIFTTAGDFIIEFYENQTSQTALVTLYLTVNEITASVSNISVQENNNGLGNMNSYTFVATLDNPNNLNVTIVWEVDSEQVGTGQTLSNYLPTTEGEHTVRAYLMLDNEIIANSSYQTVFTAKINPTASINKIEVTEVDNGLGNMNSYTFIATLNNQNNLNVTIVWEVDSEQVGTGQILSNYLPTTEGEHTIRAYLMLDNEVIADSSYQTVFTAKINPTASISKIEVTEVDNGLGKLKSYSCTAILSNLENLNVQVVWELNSVLIGTGSTITLTPSIEGTHTIRAYLIFNEAEIAGSECEVEIVADIIELPYIRGIAISEESQGMGQIRKYTFSITIINVDNVPIQVNWLVDGQFVGTGESFDYIPTTTGEIQVQAYLTTASGAQIGVVANHGFTAQRDSYLPIIIVASVVVAVIIVGVVIYVVVQRRKITFI